MAERITILSFLKHITPFFLFFFSFFFSFNSFRLVAQEAEEQTGPSPPIKQFKHSVKAGAGLPIILTNYPFRKTMDGVYSVNGSADFTIYSPVIAGVYYGYTMFDNAELKGNKGRRPDVTKGYISSAGASVGYEKFFGEDRVVSVTANSGYSWIHYKRAVAFSDTVTDLFRTEALNFGLTASYSIIIEETGGIGFYISYRFVENVFDAKKILLVAGDSKKETQLLTLGVLFTFGF